VEDEFLELLKNTNIIIASYVTAQARLKLYSYLEILQERVLYLTQTPSFTRLKTVISKFPPDLFWVT